MSENVESLRIALNEAHAETERRQSILLELKGKVTDAWSEYHTSMLNEHYRRKITIAESDEDMQIAAVSWAKATELDAAYALIAALDK